MKKPNQKIKYLQDQVKDLQTQLEIAQMDEWVTSQELEKVQKENENFRRITWAVKQ